MNSNKTINCNGKLLQLGSPAVMGIVNITPDSFYDGSRFQAADAVKARVEEIVGQGGRMVDIGGFSTRPGAADVSEQEETDRVCMAVEAARTVDADIPISIDTFRASVARACIGSGKADIINDISGGMVEDGIFEAAAQLKCPYILMHTIGHTVQEMQKKYDYDCITKDIFRYFAEKTSKLRSLGVNDIVLDPGFGFAKDVDQNYELMAHTSQFQALGLPLLVGISRKRMIWHVTGTTAKEALNGTTALNLLALQQGADILRVHDVREAVEAVKIFEQYRKHSL